MRNVAATPTTPVGDLLRGWRQRRRLSQLELATAADVSSRHLSFLETGRARPSREMLLRLADRLAIPLREQNALLLAAGFAPVHPERSLDDATMADARKAVDLVLAGHEPYPAVALDRYWQMAAANRMATVLLTGVGPELLQPPVNVLRVSLHPAGLAPRILNFEQVRAHLLHRLSDQVDLAHDPRLVALLDELQALPMPRGADTSPPQSAPPAVVIPFRLRTEHGVLSFFSTTTVFGTPVDVTLAELAFESFFPANETTADILREIARTTYGDRIRDRKTEGDPST